MTAASRTPRCAAQPAAAPAGPPRCTDARAPMRDRSPTPMAVRWLPPQRIGVDGERWQGARSAHAERGEGQDQAGTRRAARRRRRRARTMRATRVAPRSATRAQEQDRRDRRRRRVATVSAMASTRSGGGFAMTRMRADAAARAAASPRQDPGDQPRALASAEHGNAAGRQRGAEQQRSRRRRSAGGPRSATPTFGGGSTAVARADGQRHGDASRSPVMTSAMPPTTTPTVAAAVASPRWAGREGVVPAPARSGGGRGANRSSGWSSATDCTRYADWPCMRPYTPRRDAVRAAAGSAHGAPHPHHAVGQLRIRARAGGAGRVLRLRRLRGVAPARPTARRPAPTAARRRPWAGHTRRSTTTSPTDAELADEPDPADCSRQGPPPGTTSPGRGRRARRLVHPRRQPAIGPTGPTVVLAHGWSSNKSDMLDRAAILHDDYNLVLFDFRNHGAERGRGRRPRACARPQDLRAMLDWLEADEGARNRSRSSASRWAGRLPSTRADRDERVDAVIVESTHATLANAIQARLDRERLSALASRRLVDPARRADADRRGHELGAIRCRRSSASTGVRCSS